MWILELVRPAWSRTAPEGEVRMIIGKTEKRCKRQTWEGCRSTTPAVSVFLIAFFILQYHGEQSHKPVLTICCNIHTRHLFPSSKPRSFHQGQQKIQPLTWASSTPLLIVPCISKPGTLPTDLLWFRLGGTLPFSRFREVQTAPADPLISSKIGHSAEGFTQVSVTFVVFDQRELFDG